MRYILSLMLAASSLPTAFGASPIANPDTVIIRTSSRAVEIPGVLANDTDADNNTLTVVGVADGAFGTAVLDKGVISYAPGRNFAGVDMFSYRISDGQNGSSNSSSTVTVRNPFLINAGTFSGAFAGESPTNATAGYLEIRSSLAGSFSASLRFAGRKYSFKGDFDDQGNFSVELDEQTVTLHFPVEAEAAKEITGSIDPLGVVLRAPLSPFGGALPAPREGRYTLMLTPAIPGSNLPSGIGYASIRILENGRASCIGRLNDNSRWTSSTILAPDGTLPIHANVLPTPSNIFGTMTFANGGPYTILDGDLRWLRVRNPSSDVFPGGFLTDLKVKGSSYVEPNSTAAVLQITNTNPNAIFKVSGGDLRKPKVESAMLGLRPPFGDYVVPIRNSTRIRAQFEINPKTGTFIGHFRKRPSGAVRPFGGVFIQSENIGVGVFEAVRNTGKVEFTPTAVPLPN